MRQYYKEAYDKDLTNDQQPLLVSNPKKRVCGIVNVFIYIYLIYMYSLVIKIIYIYN